MAIAHALASLCDRTLEEENEFAIQLRLMCRKYNIISIADEVRMGCAKTGTFLSCNRMGPENNPI